MTLTAEQLVGYFRAEYAKSGKKRVWLFLLQFLVALPAAISVVVPDNARVTLYVLALLGFLLLLAWWFLNGSYFRGRGAAEAARRAALLVGGLGERLSLQETQSLREEFTVSIEVARQYESADYYATKLPPGPPRLAEMLEESALFTEALQKVSSNVMLWILGAFFFVFLVIALATTPFIEQEKALIALRIFLAMLVFAMSSDVLGAYRAHTAAAKKIKDIRGRLSVADLNNYPAGDVLLAMVEYNAAVESAPESVPFAYWMYGEKLQLRWERYVLDREATRAARAGR